MLTLCLSVQHDCTCLLYIKHAYSNFHSLPVDLLSSQSFSALNHILIRLDFVQLCQALKAKLYVRIAKSKLNVIQDVYWAYFRCCSSYKEKNSFLCFKVYEFYDGRYLCRVYS